jgi:hypothetical protein
MKITDPGIYRDVSDADYRSDPCPIASLTQSLAKIITERSPWHAWTESRSLNADHEPEDDAKFDLGNAAHALILGRGKDFEVLSFKDWRTKDAKAARKAAAEAGKIGILTENYDRAFDMRKSAETQIARHQDCNAFTNGTAEVMIAWEEDGVWFRSLVDWLHDDLRTIDDFKSTGMSVAEHVLGLRAEAGGWHIQAAFIERGLDILDPTGAGRRRFRFIAQETDDPFALNVMHMTEHWMTMGRKRVNAAVDIWKSCIRTNRWPGYSRHSITPDYPSFKEKQWLERELSGEFERVPSLMGG